MCINSYWGSVCEGKKHRFDITPTTLEEEKMPLYTNNFVTNASPMVPLADSSKVILTPPRSPVLNETPGRSMMKVPPSGMILSSNAKSFGLGPSGATSLKSNWEAHSVLPNSVAVASFNENQSLATLMKARAKLSNTQPSPHQEGLFQDLSSSARSEARERKRSMETRSQRECQDDDDDSDCELLANGKRRKKGNKKPSDMPRRALSAYNIFFSEQRSLILRGLDTEEAGKGDDANGTTESGKSKEGSELPSVLNRTFFPMRLKRAHRKVHGKIGLVSLARTVSQRWKELSDEKRKYYQELADKDKERHKIAMEVYLEQKAAKNMVSIGSQKQHAQQLMMEESQNSYRLAIEQERIRQQAIANQYQQAAYNDMLALRSHQHSIGQVTWIPTITTGFDPMAPQRLHPLPIQMGVPHAVIPVTQFASLPQQQNPSNDALVWRPHYWG